MRTNILHALSEKSFLYLWIGEIFTQIPTHLFNFFLILIVFKQTHSNTAVSILVLSFTIPAIIFGSLAGVYVDRWNKKTVIVVSNVLRAVLLVVLAFYLDNLIAIYTISFLVSILVQFFIPAELPMIPLVVQNKNLFSANALFGMAMFGSMLIAYVLSGPLIIFLDPVKTLLLLAVMLLIGAIFIAFIDVGQIRKKLIGTEKLQFLKGMKHTLFLMSRTTAISHSLLLLALSQILILIVATVAPGYANQVLGINVEDFPLLFVAPAAFGTIIGAIILSSIFHNHPKEKVITLGIFLSGIAMLLLPYGSKVASRDFIQTLNTYLPQILMIDILQIMMILAFILGVANALVFIPANTIIQEKTTDEFRGKIYGFLSTIVGALSLFPIIIVGGLSDLIGVGAVITGIGVSLILLSVVRKFVK